ncbi:MAG TPA: MFS transporter, partial [Gammaproteobacteria bacterium]|nr:MFS transporter [Gammaproteobacteria bacterium]
LAVLTLGALSYGLIALGEGATRNGAIALVAAAPLAWLFVRTERRARAPMMLGLFRNSSFSGANGLTVLLYAALSGALFLLPFLLIRVHGYSAMAAGAAFLPFAAIMGLGSRRSGGLVGRFGSRAPLVIGPALTAAGFVVLGLFARNPSYSSGVLPGLLIMSVGMTIAVAPLTTTVLNAVPDGMSGTASGINNAAARAGSLVAIAAIGFAIGGGAMDVDAGAITHAYRVTMWTAGALAALSALTAAATIAPRGASPANE